MCPFALGGQWVIWVIHTNELEAGLQKCGALPESKNQHFIKDGTKESSGRNLAGYAVITKCCRYIPRKYFHSKEIEYLDEGECDN